MNTMFDFIVYKHTKKIAATFEFVFIFIFWTTQNRIYSRVSNYGSTVEDI